MYNWRKMTDAQQDDLLKLRKSQKLPWHSPPHREGENKTYHLTASCYEHKPIVGASPERMVEFESEFTDVLKKNSIAVTAWVVLPNHYHALVKTENLKSLLNGIAKLHGRTSYRWNGEDKMRGRKVWFNVLEHSIKTERHFWATLNYIHNNPVHHEYVGKWQDWPFSSAGCFIEEVGIEKTREIWKKYPVLDYGKGWDSPEM